MRIIIPAAGEGRRLRPHTHITPKVLIPVAGKPILGHIFDRLIQLQPAEVVVVTGGLGARIEEYLRENYRLPLRLVAQSSPLGLGHAVLMGLKEDPAGPISIILGDTILDLPQREILADVGLLGVRVVQDPRRFGVVELKDDQIARIVEKPEDPRSNLALVGFYYLPDGYPLFEALEGLIRDGAKTRGEYQLTDGLQRLIDFGMRFKPIKVENWFDCGTPKALLKTNQSLLSGLTHYQPRPGVVIVEPVHIADSALIVSSIIGPSVSIADEVEIQDSIIRNSIIGQGARIGNALLEASLIGEYSVVQGQYRSFNLGPYSEADMG